MSVPESRSGDNDEPTPWAFFEEHPLETVEHTEFPRFDVNRDGIPDMLVSMPAYDDANPARGRVIARSGWAFGPRNLFDHTSTEPNDLYGASVLGISEFFGDASAAIVVGAPKSIAGGTVYIYTGANWDSVIRIDGIHPHAGLGFSLADVGMSMGTV